VLDARLSEADIVPEYAVLGALSVELGPGLVVLSQQVLHVGERDLDQVLQTGDGAHTLLDQRELLRLVVVRSGKGYLLHDSIILLADRNYFRLVLA
jgi:hypothetical protein